MLMLQNPALLLKMMMLAHGNRVLRWRRGGCVMLMRMVYVHRQRRRRRCRRDRRARNKVIKAVNFGGFRG